MSETRNNRKPMASIDAVLRDWPKAREHALENAEEHASEWDERAESVMGRLRRGERGATTAYVSNDDLFADPLGQSEEDGHKESAPGAPVIHPTATPRTREGKMQTIDRDRDRKSLQDLAKMAQGMTPPPSSVAAFGPVPSTRSVTNLPSEKNSKEDDSGIVDLAAASTADPHAAMRAQTTPLANASLFEDAPAPVPASYIPPPPPPNAPPTSGHHAVHAYQQPAPSVPPPSVHPSVPPPAHYASVHPIGPSLQKKKSGAGAMVFVFGSILAIGAAAAGGFLYIKSHKPAEPTATHAVESKPEAKVVAEAPKTETKPAEPAVAANDKPADGAMDLNALPNANANTSSPSKSGITKVAHHASPKAAKEPAEKPAAEPAVDPAKEKADKAKLDAMLAGNATPAPAAPAGPAGDLGKAMGDATGGGKMQDQKPAAGSSGSGSMGNVPQKPSQGAVTGALGAVLPAARECLGPDDPISKASVVFNSDGSVNSVSVSGSAAGKPAASCIEKELKKAKLQPFAEPTYTANITIRHN